MEEPTTKPVPSAPETRAQLAKLMVDMRTSAVPNDKMISCAPQHRP